DSPARGQSAPGRRSAPAPSGRYRGCSLRNDFPGCYATEPQAASEEVMKKYAYLLQLRTCRKSGPWLSYGQRPRRTSREKVTAAATKDTNASPARALRHTTAI